MQAIERMKAALELARASGSSAVPMNPEIVSEVLAYIDALESQLNTYSSDKIRKTLESTISALTAENERLRTESEERLQNCAALIAENERLRKDAERNPIAEEDLLALFARVQPRLRFTDADIRPFASGAAAAEFFHGIKGTP